VGPADRKAVRDERARREALVAKQGVVRNPRRVERAVGVPKVSRIARLGDVELSPPPALAPVLDPRRPTPTDGVGPDLEGLVADPHAPTRSGGSGARAGRRELRVAELLDQPQRPQAHWNPPDRELVGGVEEALHREQPARDLAEPTHGIGDVLVDGLGELGAGQRSS
jgi:hypothetical protein